MRAISLCRRHDCQHRVRLETVPGVCLPYLELTPRECTRFVKHDRVYPRDRIEIVSPFEQDPVTGCRPDSPEIPQRDTHHEGTRARDHQKHEGTIQPIVKDISKSRLRQRIDKGQQHDQYCQPRHHGRVHPGETTDKQLRRCFPFRGILHHFQHARQLAPVIRSRHPYPYHPIHGDHPRQHGFTLPDIPGQTLACQRRRVKCRRFAQHHAIERHPFPRLHLHRFAYLHVCRDFRHDTAPANHRRHFRAHVKQRLHAGTGTFHRCVLKLLPDGIEQHHRHSLRVFPDIKSPECRHTHQHKLVKILPFPQAANSFPQHGQTYRKKRHRIPHRPHVSLPEPHRVSPCHPDPANQQDK